MKANYISLILIASLCICSCRGKNGVAKSKPQSADSISSKDSSRSSERLGDSISIPPYGLAKVNKLIAGIVTVPDTSGGDDSSQPLDDKSYASLSLDEKFTYHMISPESYSQICDILPERTQEDKRIYGELPNIFEEYSWSDRQIDFFKTNRDSVMALMKSVIAQDGYIGANFKDVLVIINAKEMIPYLIDAYHKEKEDHYILTVLMLLMEKNKYQAFMESASWKKLYSNESNGYSAFLVYSKANEDLIIKRATDFYNGLSSK